MTSVLVVITFLAGASWGPAVSVQPFPSRDRCLEQGARVAQDIAAMAGTNLVGGASVQQNGGAFKVLVNSASARELARLSCT